jgi:hypothetical protein
VVAALLLASCSSNHAPALRSVHLQYEGPDPYTGAAKGTITADGVVDAKHNAARVRLDAGVTEIYVNDTLYVQLPGDNNAQQYEAIPFTGLTAATLHPTGFQPASLLDGASAVVALTSGGPALAATKIASGKGPPTITRDNNKNMTVHTNVGKNPATITMTYSDAPASTPQIAPPPANQILH